MAYVLVCVSDEGVTLLTSEPFTTREAALGSLRSLLDGPAADIIQSGETRLVDLDVAAPVLMVEAPAAAPTEAADTPVDEQVEEASHDPGAEEPPDEPMDVAAIEVEATTPVDEADIPPAPPVVDDAVVVPDGPAASEAASDLDEPDGVGEPEAPEEPKTPETDAPEEPETPQPDTAEEPGGSEAEPEPEEGAAPTDEVADTQPETEVVTDPEQDASLVAALQAAAEQLVADGVTAPEPVGDVAAEPMGVTDAEASVETGKRSWPWEIESTAEVADQEVQSGDPDPAASGSSEDPAVVPAVIEAEDDGGYEPGALDMDTYTCDDCVYEATCPKKGDESPATCGSFQWKSS